MLFLLLHGVSNTLILQQEGGSLEERFFLCYTCILSRWKKDKILVNMHKLVFQQGLTRAVPEWMYSFRLVYVVLCHVATWLRSVQSPVIIIIIFIHPSIHHLYKLILFESRGKLVAIPAVIR